MEKNVIIPSREMNITGSPVIVDTKKIALWWKSIRDSILKPAVWLQKYYSQILEKEISMKQTIMLVKAQAAFFIGVLPTDECPLSVRTVFLAILLWYVWKCKKSGI